MHPIASIAAILAAAGSAAAFTEVAVFDLSPTRPDLFTIVTIYSGQDGTGDFTETFESKSGDCVKITAPLLGSFASISKPTVGVECEIFLNDDCTGTSRLLNGDDGLGTDLGGSPVGTDGKSFKCTVPLSFPFGGSLVQNSLSGNIVTLTGYSTQFGSGINSTFAVTAGDCVELSSVLDAEMRSLTKPRQGVECTLYREPDCEGRSFVIPGDKGMVSNLLNTPVDDRSSSILCTVS